MTSATWAEWQQCHTLLEEWDRDRDPLTLHALADALEEAGYGRAKGLHSLADKPATATRAYRKRLGQRLRRVREWLYGTAATTG